MPQRADASCIPGFDYAIFADGKIQVQGSGSVDSWDSSVGPYSTSGTCATDGDLGTNSTTGGDIQISSGSTSVCGDIFVGAGGNPSSVVQQAGGSTITGTSAPQSTNIPLSPITVPTPALPNAPTFNPSFSNQAGVIASGFTYGDVQCQSGSLTLSAGKYVVKTLQLQAGCQLNLSSGPIEVYFTDKLEMGGGVVTNTTGIPGNLVFFGTSAAGLVQVQGGSDAFFAVYAPNALCQVQGNADVYGAIVCREAQVQGNSSIHYDKALQNLNAGGFACTSSEVSRATPVISVIANASAVVQGSFEPPAASQPTFNNVAQLATWSFPYIKGHMRARVASTVTGNSLSSGTVLFDAGATGNIPPVNNAGCGSFSTSCRNVFTTTNTPNGTTLLPTVVQLNDGNASTIGALITAGLTGFGAPQWQTIVRTVLAGSLGGVDRSTVAVIEPSSVAGSARAKIAYFGATDGMLHAVCASVGPGCPALGKELWAFLPRTQLPLIPGNTTRIDGSVRVVDMFGDFPTAVSGSPYTAPTPANGKRSFRTLLFYQTGFALGTTPAAYALDITDPTRPIVLWEYATPASAAAIDFGTGIVAAAGPTVINGTTTNLVVLATNNGGSSTTTNAVVVTTLVAETGALQWQFTHTYASPPRGVAGDLMPVPFRGVPGGAVGIDLSNRQDGFITDYLFGDLYGSLWRVDAGTGSPPTTGSGFTCTRAGAALPGCVPIFSFTGNKRPIGTLPTVFSRVAGGDQFVAFASGGYVDPVSTLWSQSQQKVIAVKVKPSTLPESDATSACSLSTCNVLVNANLAVGDRAFASALVVGTKLFVTTDTSDVNLSAYGQSGSSTGHLYSMDILAGATTVVGAPTSTFRGAGGLANDRSASIAYTGTGASVVTTTSGGVTVDPSSTSKLTRRLWLSN